MRARRERDGRELGIIGIDNPHNVSVSRMNAHFPICVVSPRERERARRRGRRRAEKRRSHRAELGSLNPSILLTVNFSRRHTGWRVNKEISPIGSSLPDLEQRPVSKPTDSARGVRAPPTPRGEVRAD